MGRSGRPNSWQRSDIRELRAVPISVLFSRVIQSCTYSCGTAPDSHRLRRFLAIFYSEAILCRESGRVKLDGAREQHRQEQR